MSSGVKSLRKHTAPSRSNASISADVIIRYSSTNAWYANGSPTSMNQSGTDSVIVRIATKS
jgi:hypothetical protein